MTGRDCAIPAEREARDVANAGFVRPPFVYLAAILVGSALHIAWPLHFLPYGIAPLGAVLVAAAAALFVTSVRQFRAAGTPSTWRSRCCSSGSRRWPTASGCS